MKRAILVLALLATSCGVEPTGLRDGGPAPVISPRPRLATVFLVRGGRLEASKVAVAGHTIDEIMKGLFAAGARSDGKLSTALAGLGYKTSQITPFTADRSDPDTPDARRMDVFITGSGRVTETALAQMTCTAVQQRQDIWAVRVIRQREGSSEAFPEHSCRDFWDLANETTRLPR